MSRKRAPQPILKRHLAFLRRQHTILGEVIAELERLLEPSSTPSTVVTLQVVAQQVKDDLPALSGRQQAKALHARLGGEKGIEACRSLLRRIRE